MIKRFRFESIAAGADRSALPTAWPRALGGLLTAPADVRPARVAAAFVAPGLGADDDLHDIVAIEWYDDAEHLARLDDWLATGAGRSVADVIASLVDPDRSRTVVAVEEIGRGADYLAGRWSEGGEKLKHMAIAMRAAGLTPAAFSELWRTRAGKIGKSGGTAVVLPPVVKGLAYVQNHPLPTDEGWGYDAVNEVYFDDVDDLRARIAFFREQMTPDAEADLVSQASFLAVREVPVVAVPAG